MQKYGFRRKRLADSGKANAHLIGSIFDLNFFVITIYSPGFIKSVHIIHVEIRCQIVKLRSLYQVSNTLPAEALRL